MTDNDPEFIPLQDCIPATPPVEPMWWHEIDTKWFKFRATVDFVELENFIGHTGNATIDVADLTDKQAAGIAERLRLQFLANVQRRRETRSVRRGLAK